MSRTADASPDEPSGRPSEKDIDLTKVASWDGDRLVLHESALNAVRRDSLSPSTANAMTGCPSRWVAERLMPHRVDPFSAAELGTSTHSIFEDFFDRPKFQRTRATALRLLEAHKKALWPSTDQFTVAKAAEWHGRVYQLMDGLWQIEDPMHVDVAAIETALPDGTTVCDIPFIGYIDRVDEIVDKDGNAAVRIVDYKTGKMPDRNKLRYGDNNGDQMRLYNEAYTNAFGVRPTQATLYYTQFGKKRDAALSKPYMTKTLTAFRKAWADLKSYEESASFPTKASPLCGWCPLVNTCPVAKAAGYTDRTAGQTAPKEGDFHIPVMRPIAPEIPIHFDDDFGSASVDDSFTGEIVDETAQEPAPATHLNSETNPDTPEAPMSNPTFSHNKAWVTESDELLNASSYAATAMFGTTTLAYELLRKAEMPLKGNIDALSKTLMHIVSTVQHELGRHADNADYDAHSLGSGLNARLRGALRTYIELDPVPFGASEPEFDKWVGRAIAHTRSMALAANRLYREPQEDRPWAALTVRQTPAA